VGEARDGSAAIEMALSLVPQVVIMDIKMPRLGGVEATRRIKRILPETYVIGVSLDDDALTQEAMKAAGASAFLSKCHVRDLPQLIATLTGRRVSEEGPRDGCLRRPEAGAHVAPTNSRWYFLQHLLSRRDRPG
jgi:DNA-binding NarL/FixJ family response regulator